MVSLKQTIHTYWKDSIYVLFPHKHIVIPENLYITIANERIECKETVKFLGYTKLNWNEHLTYINTKLNSSLFALRVKQILYQNH